MSVFHEQKVLGFGTFEPVWEEYETRCGTCASVGYDELEIGPG